MCLDEVHIAVSATFDNFDGLLRKNTGVLGTGVKNVVHELAAQLVEVNGLSDTVVVRVKRPLLGDLARHCQHFVHRHSAFFFFFFFA